jgi:hypothetical protein
MMFVSSMFFYQVKLGEPGWKERYYEEKFSAKSLDEMEAVRRDVVSTCTTVATDFECTLSYFCEISRLIYPFDIQLGRF